MNGPARAALGPARRSRPAVSLALAGLAALVLVVAASSCSARVAGPTPADAPRVTWPPPPDEPRIELVSSFSRPQDLGIRRGWFSRALRYLFVGRRVVEMARPIAIATAPGERYAIADPDARSVHIFDVAANRYLRVAEAEDRPLVSPVGVAFDDAGLLFVADSYRREIHVLDAEGRWLRRLAGPDGLARPTGLAWDSREQRLLAVDTGAHRLLGFDADGQKVLDVGGRGSEPGRFNFPVSVGVDRDSRIFVSDAMNFRVQVLDRDGAPVSTFGAPGRGPGTIDKAKGIAVDSDGNVYLVDALHDVIQVFDGEGRLLTVIGGRGTQPGRFWLPSGIFVDGSDRILVADSANRRVQILRYLGGTVRSGGG